MYQPAAAAGREDDDALRLQRYLDAIGVPWRDSYAALVERFGMSPEPLSGSGVIAIATARPFVRGMLLPLQVRAGGHREPSLPVAQFESHLSYGLGAQENLRQAVLLLQAVLGRGQARDDAKSHVWHFGRSYVELDPGHDDAPDAPHADLQVRAPSFARRLDASARLTINNGWRRPLDAQDEQALAGFAPIMQFDEGLDHTLTYKPTLTGEWDYLREPGRAHAPLFRWVGWSHDRATLIVFNTQFYMIPVVYIIGVEVTRLLPARGGGGSTLYLKCRSGRPDGATRWLELANGSQADALSEPAARIAAALGMPCTLRPYETDA